jgi:Predicted transcriptional regulators
MGGAAARAYMSIGEVLALLQGEFPEITVSKIRFLEAEGLIEPQRTPSGYRKFTHADVERLRYILTAQRDRYLPLRVIKTQLEDADQGMFQRPRPLDDQPPPVPVRLGRDELIKNAGIDSDTLDELESFGLIAPRGRHYDADALRIARTAAELARFGIHPRHLRAIRAAAERQVALVEQAVAPLLRRRAPGAAAEADESARELSGLLLDLHAALLRVGVRGVLGR